MVMLSIMQAKRELNVSYNTVYRLIRANKLPASKVGRVWRIKREDLDEYLQRTRHDEISLPVGEAQ